MRSFARSLVLASTFFVPTTPALAVSIDFEALADSAPVGDLFANLGVSFSNAISLTAGISLNEFEFPPSSGTVAIADDTGPMALTFSDAVTAFSANFSFRAPLTITAYADSALNDPILEILSPASSNTGSTDRISLEAHGINSIRISGGTSGSSFVLDDLTFSTAQSQPPIPEPESIIAFLTGLAIIGLRVGRIRRFSR